MVMHTSCIFRPYGTLKARSADVSTEIYALLGLKKNEKSRSDDIFVERDIRVHKSPIGAI
jgi:hypothetical protein